MKTKVSARPRILIRQRRWDEDKANIPRWMVYDEDTIPSRPIRFDASTTMETRRQAEKIWQEIESRLGKYKMPQKRAILEAILHSAKQAIHHDGCLRVSRNLSEIRLQLVDAMVGAGYFHEHRSPKGSPKMSRLLPLAVCENVTESDPWKYDPQDEPQLVFLRDREDKTDIPFDSELEIVIETQERLRQINQVNSLCKITYEPVNRWFDYEDRKRLRPVHYAIFTEDFTKHGRIYTGKYGHQSLRKVERKTIMFNHESGVEYDFGGMHPRLLYHLEGLDYTNDPYSMWPKTSKILRAMAKIVVNTAINAKSRKAAVSACNSAMCIYKNSQKGKSPVKKTGKALQRARRLIEAKNETGLSFAKIYDHAEEFHKSISHYFGSDMGMNLMRIDSEIALDIMSHFTMQGIPCLGCHDSFLVPYHARYELQQIMAEIYQKRLDHFPTIKLG